MEEQKLPKGYIILHGYQSGNEYVVNANLIGKIMTRTDANKKAFTAIYINGCNRTENGATYPSVEVRETVSEVLELIKTSQTFSL